MRIEKWEYIQKMIDEKDLSELGVMGDAGWELCAMLKELKTEYDSSMVNHTGQMICRQITYYQCIFKRPHKKFNEP